MAFRCTKDFLLRCWHLLKPEDPYHRFAKIYERTIDQRINEVLNSGEQIVHLIILKDEDKVDWNDYCPPKLKYECTQVLRDSEVFKFFQRNQHFLAAKKFLFEKDFMKVDCGLESFPMDGRQPDLEGAEFVYNYVKRPFIHLSSVEQGQGSRQMLLQAIGPAFTSE